PVRGSGEAGVGVDEHRDLHGGADARIVVGVVAYVGLAHVGLRQHGAVRRVAAGEDRVKTFAFDDAGGERVVGAGQHGEARRGDEVAEFSAQVHDVLLGPSVPAGFSSVA